MAILVVRKRMVNLNRRSEFKEYLDHHQAVDEETLRQTYRQISIINGCTLVRWTMINAVKYFLLRSPHKRSMRILDIGCGDGEVLRRIDRLGRANHWSLQLTGIDSSPGAIAAARDTDDSKRIEFIQCNIFENNFNDYDLIISSLTTHHMTNNAVVRLLRRMTYSAKLGWFIADLNRNIVAYYFIKYFVRFSRFNTIVCHDAPLSVARGFRKEEWSDFLFRAGVDLDCVKIAWYPNFHYGIRYEKCL